MESDVPAGVFARLRHGRASRAEHGDTRSGWRNAEVDESRLRLRAVPAPAVAVDRAHGRAAESWTRVQGYGAV